MRVFAQNVGGISDNQFGHVFVPQGDAYLWDFNSTIVNACMNLFDIAWCSAITREHHFWALWGPPSCNPCRFSSSRTSFLFIKLTLLLDTLTWHCYYYVYGHFLF